GRRRHEVEARQDVVELDGTGFAFHFVDGETHCHAHEKSLRQFDTPSAHMQEVAVIKRLQAEVAELEVAVGIQRRTQGIQVETAEALIEEASLDALSDEFGKVPGIA